MRRGCARRHTWRAPTASSTACRTAMPPRSASAAARCRWGSDSSWRWRACWRSIRRCWSWTKPRRASTPRPSCGSAPRCTACCRRAARSSSRTGCRRSRTAIASWCWRAAGCANRARTPTCCARVDCTRACTSCSSAIRRRRERRGGAMVTPAPRSAGLGLGRRAVWVLVGLGLVLVLDLAARFVVEVLWFRELEALPVLWVRLRTQVGLAALGLLLSFALLAAVVVGALRRGPALRSTRDGGIRIVPMDQRLRPLALGAAALLAVGFAAALAGHWLELRLAGARVPYGVREPWFGRDVGDFVFLLPAIRIWLDWGLSLVALAFGIGATLEAMLAAMAGARSLPHAARRRLGLLGAPFLLPGPARAPVAPYDCVYAPHGVVHAAGYTDVKVRLPAFRTLAVLAAAAAVAVAIGAWRGRGRWVVLVPAAWGLLAVIGLGILPAAVQKLVVEPNELEKERPYLEAAIRSTRNAYDLDAIDAKPTTLDRNLDAERLAAHADVLANIRLWDWQPLLATYGQIQEIRLYYDFLDVDVDRYTLDGAPRQLMLSAREIAYD